MKAIFRDVFIVTLVTLLAVACGGSSDSEEGVADISTACQQIGLPLKVINGVACGNLEQSPVVKIGLVLTVEGQNYLAQVCTGTMIAPNKVLTAQHCISQDGRFEGYPVTATGIVYGEATDNRFIAAKRIDLMAGYVESNDRLFNDVAVITLSRDTALPTLPVLLSQDPEIGSAGWIYGYGQTQIGSEDVPDSAIDFTDLNAGVMRIEEVTPNHVFVKYAGSGSNVCFGDSGGPLVYMLDGEPVVVGVTSQGSVEDCGPGDITTYTKMSNDLIHEWLKKVASSAQYR